MSGENWSTSRPWRRGDGLPVHHLPGIRRPAHSRAAVPQHVRRHTMSPFPSMPKSPCGFAVLCPTLYGKGMDRLPSAAASKPSSNPAGIPLCAWARLPTGLSAAAGCKQISEVPVPSLVFGIGTLFVRFLDICVLWPFAPHVCTRCAITLEIRCGTCQRNKKCPRLHLQIYDVRKS